MNLAHLFLKTSLCVVGVSACLEISAQVDLVKKRKIVFTYCLTG